MQGKEVLPFLRAVGKKQARSTEEGKRSPGRWHSPVAEKPSSAPHQASLGSCLGEAESPKSSGSQLFQLSNWHHKIKIPRFIMVMRAWGIALDIIEGCPLSLPTCMKSQDLALTDAEDENVSETQTRLCEPVCSYNESMFPIA